MKYRILTASSPINEEQLDELWCEGWQFIAAVQWHGTFYFYFARLSA